MSRFHRALVASVSSLAATSAFAQAEIKPTVTPYGIIQNYFHLMDSSRQNVLDSSPMVVRIGFKANYGLAIGQIEMQATANGCDARYTKTTDDAGTVTEANNCVDKNQINVRRSDVGLAIKTDGGLTITPSFGRVRPGDIGGWGVDVTNTTDGFGSMDGFQLAVKVDLGEGNSVDLGANYGNSVLDVANLANVQLHSGASFARDQSGDNSRGYVLSAKASISGVKAAFFYGGEGNHMVGKVGSANGFAQPKTVADFSRWEAALGYDMGAISAGLTAWQYSWGKEKAVDANENGKIKVGAETGKKASNVLNYGLGMNGDSTLFGVQDLLQKDDKLTYGLSFIKTTEDSGVDGADKVNGTQIAVGAGYALGGLQIELNFANWSSSEKVYSNKKGDEKVKSMSAMYLSSVYVF